MIVQNVVVEVIGFVSVAMLISLLIVTLLNPPTRD